jgi:hypothetical protein
MEWLESDARLEARILSKIAKIQKQRLFYKLAFDWVACAVFFSLGIFASLGTWQVLTSPTFKSLLALAMSDLPTVLSYWQDFSYSVLEILPMTTIAVLGLAIIMTGLFARDISVKKSLLKNI